MKKMYGYNSDDMKPKVEDLSKSSSEFSQGYGQSPLNYVERQDKRQSKEASQLRKEAHKGRY